MSQTALTENAPLTLDTTCSFRKIWPAYASIRMDKRRECRPDIVADARYLPFRDGIFAKVYCDPPHLIAGRTSRIKFYGGFKRRKERMDMFTRYGYWVYRSDWLAFLEATNQEFSRVLTTSGTLLYKITDGKAERGDKGGTTNLREMEKMTKFEIVNDRPTPSKSNSKSTVHWLTMKPNPPCGQVEGKT